LHKTLLFDLIDINLIALFFTVLVSLSLRDILLY
jgi:hypothetical protein